MSTATVLIVEDELILQELYELVLSSKGYTVFTASNGIEGLNKTTEVRPDMILLDVFMPVMDGKEFLRNIDLTDYPNTKIVVYSNLSDDKTINEMIGLGAERFVLKSSMTPVDLVELVEEITTKS